LVSCSKNGNSWKGAEDEYMLYPRFADRLESLGEIGIVRCWLYTSHVERPLFTDETLRPTTREELKKVASSERFQTHGKESTTFIDHFYDKLLHLTDVGTNPYFQKELEKRIQIMEEFLLDFGLTGVIDEEHLKRLVKKYF
jgi:uncharacterized protein